MPDIDVFDPRAYFDNKVREMEQEVIAKQARLAICQSNQQRLDRSSRSPVACKPLCDYVYRSF